MLSKSISPLSLPLSLRFSPPSAYATTIATPYRPTISQDAYPAWTRRAQPVADPDRRTSLRPEIQPRSILKALPLLSAIPTVRPFASSASCRGKPRPADVRNVRIIVDDDGDARRMRVHHRYSEGQIARGASRRNLWGWLWGIPVFRELSRWNFNFDDAAIASLMSWPHMTTKCQKCVDTVEEKGNG